jgi:hypothetical protein
MTKGFKCPKCNYKFSTKGNLDRHLENKVDCVTGKKTNRKAKFECNYCNKKFTRVDHFKAHVIICKININNNNNLNNVGDKNINTNGNHNENNNNSKNNYIDNSTCNISLMMFAKDGISCLKWDDVNKIVKSKNHPIEEMVKIVNFDENKKEHHNVFCNNSKDGNGYVYEDEEWITKTATEIVSRIIDAKKNDISKLLQESKGTFSQEATEKLENVVKDAQGYHPYENSRKRLMSYIKNILVNGKEMVKCTKMEMKQSNQYNKNITMNETTNNRYSDSEINDPNANNDLVAINKWLENEIDEITQLFLDIPINRIDATISEMNYFLTEDSIINLKILVKKIHADSTGYQQKQQLIGKIKNILYENREEMIMERRLTKKQMDQYTEEIIKRDEMISYNNIIDVDTYIDADTYIDVDTFDVWE